MSPLITSFAGASLRPYGWASSSGATYNDFELISSQTLGTGVSSVSFSSIPQTYKHLQLRLSISASTTGSLTATLRFNSDTGSNYWGQWLYAESTTITSSSNSAAQTSVQLGGAVPNAGSYLPSQLIIDVPDYTNTNKNKALRSFEGYGSSSTVGHAGIYEGLWLSSSAITGITVNGSQAFRSTSTLSLYGIKG